MPPEDENSRRELREGRFAPMIWQNVTGRWPGGRLAIKKGVITMRRAESVAEYKNTLREVLVRRGVTVAELPPDGGPGPRDHRGLEPLHVGEPDPERCQALGREALSGAFAPASGGERDEAVAHEGGNGDAKRFRTGSIKSMPASVRRSG